MSAEVPPIDELRRICRPQNRTQVWFVKFVIRPISIYLTKALLYTPVTANQVTFTMLIIGLAAGALFIFHNYWASVAAGLLLVFNIVLDCTDGEIARFRKTSSMRGIFLDRLTHITAEPFVFVGLTFGVYAKSNDIRIIILGFSASLFTLLKILGPLERSVILKEAGQKPDARSIISTIAPKSITGGGRVSKSIANIKKFVPDVAFDDKFTVIAILIGAIFARLDIVLIVYGIILPLRWLLQTVFDFGYGF